MQKLYSVTNTMFTSVTKQLNDYTQLRHLSVCLRKSAAARAVYAACLVCGGGSFGAAFAKCLWPLVTPTIPPRHEIMLPTTS